LGTNLARSDALLKFLQDVLLLVDLSPQLLKSLVMFSLHSEMTAVPFPNVRLQLCDSLLSHVKGLSQRVDMSLRDSSHTAIIRLAVGHDFRLRVSIA